MAIKYMAQSDDHIDQQPVHSLIFLHIISFLINLLASLAFGPSPKYFISFACSCNLLETST